MYKKLLVPLDGSRLAEAVLPIAAVFAGQPEARVVLLHILERSAPSQVHGEPHLTETAEAERYLETVAQRLQRSAPKTTVECHAHPAPEGDVASSIVDHAREEGAELILLCTHGKGNVRQKIFGSIAQQVLRRGTLPVLIARPPADEGQGVFSPRKILVPLDATAFAETAIAPARELALMLRAAIHLVMVVATSGTVRGDRIATATLLPAATREALQIEDEESEAYLLEIAESLGRDGIEVTVEVRRGDPTSALPEEAAESDIGLVVVATHGRAGLQALWSGSVTARVLDRITSPVLLLRKVDD